MNTTSATATTSTATTAATRRTTGSWTRPAADRTPRRVAAVAMAGAAALAIAGFTALGSIFDYPAVLDEPTAEILASFHEHQAGVMAWFAVLTLSAALLAPVGIILGRIVGGRQGRWLAIVGVAAAAVQVIGLSRWFLFVPGLSDDALVPARTADAADMFDLLHTWLGKALGETVGYALTATFTVLLLVAVLRRIAPRWVRGLGWASAALITTGVVIPLGLEVASLTNFAGYVAWCVWLLATAVILWRRSPLAPAGA
jgi:hypothetical protein